MGIPPNASGGSEPSPTSLEIARQLLARRATPENNHDPQVVGPALQQTCLRVFGILRDSMGDEGCNALLVRALRRVEAHHPPLRELHRGNGRIYLDVVAASVETHGVAPVTAAIEALFASLIDLLTRLIGEDMTVRLIDQDPRRPRPGSGAPAP